MSEIFKEKPKAVFFDWDGTLADSYEYLNGAHGHVRQIMGLRPFKEGEFKHYFGKPREILYEILYGKENFDRAKELFGEYVKNNRHILKPVDGALDLLLLLREANVPMGIVTNKLAELVGGEIEHFGWNGYFDAAIVGAGEAGADKPSPEPLLLAIKRSGEKLDEKCGDVWYVGDTPNDLHCALQAGCPVIMISDDPKIIDLCHKESENSNHNIMVVKNCRELCGFLLQ